MENMTDLFISARKIMDLRRNNPHLADLLEEVEQSTSREKFAEVMIDLSEVHLSDPDSLEDKIENLYKEICLQH